MGYPNSTTVLSVMPVLLVMLRNLFAPSRLLAARGVKIATPLAMNRPGCTYLVLSDGSFGQEAFFLTQDGCSLRACQHEVCRWCFTPAHAVPLLAIFCIFENRGQEYCLRCDASPNVDRYVASQLAIRPCLLCFFFMAVCCFHPTYRNALFVS